MQTQHSLDTSTRLFDLFKQYPSLATCLSKLQLSHPTYLQSQILTINSEIENIVICAPEGHGKKIGSLLYSLKKFVNIESGVMAVLVYSKQAAFQVQHILTGLTHLEVYNTYQRVPEQSEGKMVVVGSPTQFENLHKQIKDRTEIMVAMEFQYLMSFGYGDCMRRVYEVIKPMHVIVCSSQIPELAEFKEKFLKKTLNVTLENQPEAEKVEAQVSHFFSVDEPIFKQIALYMIMKFGLVHPKVLVICEDQREVYKNALFLDRCRIRNVGVYNSQNPVNVKFYSISLWLAGKNNILLATPDFFKDVKSSIFAQNCKRNYKHHQIDMKNLSAIITMNISYLRSQFNELFDHFPGRARIINLIDNKDSQRQVLQKLIKYQKQHFQTVKIKEFPLSRQEMQAFNYRISDVYGSIGGRRADWFAVVDLNKKILKSKDMAGYFETHPDEKQVLQKKIMELTKKVNMGKVELGEELPEYLLPEFLKGAYMQRIREQEKEIFKRLKPKKQKQKADGEEAGEEGKMEVEDGENPPAETKRREKDTVQTKIGRALASINPDEQNPETTDPSRLKILSGRKRWKLLHGFKLKKRNMRKQRRGIFE